MNFVENIVGCAVVINSIRLVSFIYAFSSVRMSERWLNDGAPNGLLI